MATLTTSSTLNNTIHVLTVYVIATDFVLLVVGKFNVQIDYFSFLGDRPMHATQVL
ncbi:hypothetical protein [Calothrix sp. NIES-2100]|uniref:hypothetical protein n=1 Tax=Calothrix sp. NIES-2100 TaxID=1954172 RepID=UPI0030DBF7E5